MAVSIFNIPNLAFRFNAQTREHKHGGSPHPLHLRCRMLLGSLNVLSLLVDVGIPLNIAAFFNLKISFLTAGSIPKMIAWTRFFFTLGSFLCDPLVKQPIGFSEIFTEQQQMR